MNYFFGSLLLFGPFLITSLALGLVVLGAIWAPFAALICVLIARSRGFSPYRYAVAGMVYSVLFFLPWVYLVTRMCRRSVSIMLIRLVYVLVYGVWLLGSILLTFMDAIVFSDTTITTFGDINQQNEATALFISLPFNVLTLIASLILLLYKSSRSPFYHRDRPGESPLDVLPDPVFVLPFVYLLIWLIVPNAILVLIGE